MSAPLVSVVMGTYNHEPFVAEAIKSVVTQDFTDFEFLIADDGSSDATARVVASYSDPRISFQPNAVNKGAALVLNDLIGTARGRYVAVINSDDAWLPGKLSEQVRFLEQNPNIGAVFGRVDFVDRDGAVIEKDTLSFGHVFDQLNRSRGEWLQQFFWRGNCLCHPTVLIRREIYQKVGLYDNRYRQLPDLDMWIRVVKTTDIHVSEDEMIRFRILPGENASSDTSTNRVRTLNEHFLIGMNFFDNVSAELLTQGFGAYLGNSRLKSEACAEIEKAFLYLHPTLSLDRAYRIVALIKFSALLADESYREVLSRHYEFDDRAFHGLSAEIDDLQTPTPNLEGVNSAAVSDERPPPERDIALIPTKQLGEIIRKRLLTRMRLMAKGHR